jgi:hypothetical protein
MLSVRVTTYQVYVLGETSQLVLDPSVAHTVNTGSATVDTAATSRTTYC